MHDSVGGLRYLGSLKLKKIIIVCLGDLYNGSNDGGGSQQLEFTQVY